MKKRNILVILLLIIGIIAFNPPNNNRKNTNETQIAEEAPKISAPVVQTDGTGDLWKVANCDITSGILDMIKLIFNFLLMI